MNNWIDVSVPLRNGMVHWPGDPAFNIERFLDREKGAEATVSGMSLSVHTGTHMDAPLHFVRGGRPIDEMPIETTVGKARVIEITHQKWIEREELTRHAISRGDRILFKTANSARCWNTDKFTEDYVALSPDAARCLAESGVRCIGIDYLSVGAFRGTGTETHRILLEAGIWIIEGLNLRAVDAGDYEMACLPLRLTGSDGAPARAILRRIE